LKERGSFPLSIPKKTFWARAKPLESLTRTQQVSIGKKVPKVRKIVGLAGEGSPTFDFTRLYVTKTGTWAPGIKVTGKPTTVSILKMVGKKDLQKFEWAIQEHALKSLIRAWKGLRLLRLSQASLPVGMGKGGKVGLFQPQKVSIPRTKATPEPLIKFPVKTSPPIILFGKDVIMPTRTATISPQVAVIPLPQKIVEMPKFSVQQVQQVGIMQTTQTTQTQTKTTQTPQAFRTTTTQVQPLLQTQPQQTQQLPQQTQQLETTLQLQKVQTPNLQLQQTQVQRISQILKSSAILIQTIPKTTEIFKKENFVIKKVGKKYVVYVRKFGEDVKIATRPTLSSAKAVLFKELRKTLRASGFITEDDVPIEINFLGKEFRKGKKEPFRIVQKKEFRLGAPSETKEIQFFRKVKKKKGGLFL